jgi:hypothetical protein
MAAEDCVSEKPRVVIATPLYGHPSPWFLVAFARLLIEVGASGVGAGWCFTTIPYIDQARNQLVRDALTYDPTHIFWVDHDVTCPPDAVTKLLAHDLPVVGGMYHSKDVPYGPVAFGLDPFEMYQEIPPSMDLHLVGGLGMGATLVKASIYRLMKAHYEDERWYEVKAAPAIGEDVHFAMRLQEMAVPVFLDLKVQCGHIRDHVVTAGDYLAARSR